MSLVDYFRPKWKHSDAEVRASAVRQLGTEEVDILHSIARHDSDAAVRRIAIKKISDPAILLEVAQNDPDESLRQIAAETANTLLLNTAVAEHDAQASRVALDQLSDPKALGDVAKTASLEPIRRAAVLRLTDARALADVAKNAADPTIRLDALRKVTDLSVLRSVALNDSHKEVALTAVENIAARDALEMIAKKSKIKAVRVQAQRKLISLKDEEARPTVDKLQHAQRVQLCRTVESLLRATNVEQAMESMQEAQATWQEIAEAVDKDLGQRFQRACDAFHARWDRHREQMTAQAQRTQDLRTNLSARIALCETVESLVEGEDMLDRLAQARAAWENLAPIPEAQRSVIDPRFAKACQSCEKRYALRCSADSVRSEMEKLCAEAEQLAASPSLWQAKQNFRALEERWKEQAKTGPLQEELHARFLRAGKQLAQREEEIQKRRAQRKQENLVRLEALCATIEDLAQTQEIKSAERRLKAAQVAFRKAGPLPSPEKESELRQRFHAARERVLARLHELREAEDWKRWSNVPQLEDLCVRAEALLAETNLKEAAQQLKKLQTEWKRIGSVSKDKGDALWARFKQACDGVFGRCQDYFVQLENERAENLTQKELLCEKVEVLADSTNWTETAEQIKQLQIEWKTIGAVPREHSEVVWRRFRKACDHFFARRQSHQEQVSEKRTENIKKKEALCEHVEALAGSTDWAKTVEVIKHLQHEWKRIGPVPRSKADALWQRFRGACDQFFDRRQQHQDRERQANLTRKEQICSELESLLPRSSESLTLDPASIAERLQQAQTEWRQIGPPPRINADAIRERYHCACERIVESYPEAFQGTDLDMAANLSQREKLCLQVEAFAAHAPKIGGTAETMEEMAAQLRYALAANTFSDEPSKKQPSWSEMVDEVKRIQAAWKKIGPVPREQGLGLWLRFRQACDFVFDRQRRALPLEENQLTENLAQKQALCAQAEKLAAVSSPALHRDTIKELQQQWKAIGPVPQHKARNLWHRFRRACNRVLRNSTMRESRVPAALPDTKTLATEGALSSEENASE